MDKINVEPINLEALLAKTEAFIHTMHYVYDDFTLIS